MDPDAPGYHQQVALDLALQTTGLSGEGLRASWSEIVLAARAIRNGAATAP
jgi:hypothetical protein